MSSFTWHSRLGNVSSFRLNSLCSSGLLGNLKHEKFDCAYCQLEKHHALPFNNSDSISSNIFDLVHTDILEPSLIATMGGASYFVIFVDDYFRLTWIYFMKNRSIVPNLC